MAYKPKYDAEKKQRKCQEILDAIAQAIPQKKAAEAAGLNWRTWFLWRKADPELDRQCIEAMDIAFETLEFEARRRAINGVKRPIFQGGKCVGYETQYSDNLLLALLRRHAPHLYERGAAIDVKNMSDEELHKIAGTDRVRGAGATRAAAAGAQESAGVTTEPAGGGGPAVH